MISGLISKNYHEFCHWRKIEVHYWCKMGSVMTRVVFTILALSQNTVISDNQREIICHKTHTCMSQTVGWSYTTATKQMWIVYMPVRDGKKKSKSQIFKTFHNGSGAAQHLSLGWCLSYDQVLCSVAPWWKKRKGKVWIFT